MKEQGRLEKHYLFGKSFKWNILNVPISQSWKNNPRKKKPIKYLKKITSKENSQ